MKKAIIYALCITMSAACNDNSTASSSSSESYETTKMSLEDKEKSEPLQFLSVEGAYRKNLIDQWVVEGTITNNATLAKYKDVVLKIVYTSQTGTEVGSEEKILYEFFTPGTTHEFKIKTNGYEGAASVGLDIISAVAVE